MQLGDARKSQAVQTNNGTVTESDHCRSKFCILC